MTNETLNQTIPSAERDLYLALIEWKVHRPIANKWLANLPKWLSDVKDKRNYAHAPTYLATIEQLPMVVGSKAILDTDAITIDTQLSTSQNKQITSLMRQLMPWRKGPFQIGTGDSEVNDNSVYIDTEWHSDWKWNRIAPHIGNLENRYVLDVGGGSGYHGWRMAGMGAKEVVIADPSCLFYFQFMAIKHFIRSTHSLKTHSINNRHFAENGQGSNVHYVPVGLEALPASSDQGNQLFDTVFCMGVLYHRQSPFEHLNQLKNQLIKGGQLVLETLVIDGDTNTVLVPHNRYAKMNNVYFIPSVASLIGWLEKAGFSDVTCVDIDVTSTEEQRATDWMTYQSLSDFLDPNDCSKTIEGYPAPMRATLIATKP